MQYCSINIVVKLDISRPNQGVERAPDADSD